MIYYRRLHSGASKPISHASRPTLRAHIVGDGQE